MKNPGGGSMERVDDSLCFEVLLNSWMELIVFKGTEFLYSSFN